MQSSSISILFTLTVIFGCNSFTSEDQKADVNCKIKYKIIQNDSFITIEYSNKDIRTLNKFSKGKNSSLDILIDSIDNVLIVATNEKLTILSDSINQVLNEFYFKGPYFLWENKKINKIQDYTLFSSGGNVTVFDKYYITIYSSYDTLGNINDTTLGLSGVEMNYNIINNDLLIIEYDLITDVSPFHFATLYDTLILNKKY